jgi:muramoyltetrapeptide carboxypeptidase
MATIRNKLIRPPRLNPGDTIGIVAPASPFDTDLFDGGIQTLKSMGYRVHIPDDLFERNGFLAGSDEHRADLIHRLFSDQTIKALVCARGGYGSMRLLPVLDFSLIQKNPKIFIGLSDVSALLSAIYSKTGLVTFHGPAVTTLANTPRKTREALKAAISSDQPHELEMENGITIRSGSASGRVCGGNLNTLNHLLGTPFAPEFKDHLLFLEDRGEKPYRIDRMLTQMKQAGCFRHLAGLILGDFVDCGSQPEIIQIFTEAFADASIPIVAGCEAGHGRQNLTIPFGLEATLDAENCKLSFHQPATM